ncbi:MAG TPA: shikimate kinase [Vicinamibacterales bacterium]|jgi:XRE family aerobic/anaerobic benzoate catabolism transcriptional regulator|nr:shikimate kinase [Vicinamibacterales bacterium]
MSSDILAELGRRARARRIERGWTLRDVAERSGVSPRFLVQLEGGRGNISVRRLADVARALETTPAALLAESAVHGEPVVALLGLRGAGKTTIGRRLAKRLHVSFVELDRRIEQAADLSLSELFSLHGEEYYRRLEREVLDSVLAEGRPMVLATGGGIVTASETYAALRRSATTVWLRARPEDHWNRVVRQGDRRPMADHPQAMADLRTLLASREPLYASAAHTVDTFGRTVDEIVEEVAAVVRSAIPE